MRKRCKYQVRYFYSKGAFLVLLWSSLVSAAWWSYMTEFGEGILEAGFALDRNTFSQVFTVLPFLAYLTIPLLGWLADAKLGNYRVFKFSCFFLVVASIIMCINILCAPKINASALHAVHKCCHCSTSIWSGYSKYSSLLHDSLTAWSRSNARCFFH